MSTSPISPGPSNEIACALVPALSAPAVRLDLRRAFYPVIGSTVRQLRTVLWTLGPVRSGRRFGAFTDWEIAWRYRHTDDEGGRRICEASIDVLATITSPIWRPPPMASSGLISAWKEYVAAIEAHEQGHIALALEAAAAVRSRLLALPTLSSKDALDGAARAEAEEVLRDAREREISYDHVTRHGAEQGVIFPM